MVKNGEQLHRKKTEVTNLNQRNIVDSHLLYNIYVMMKLMIVTE